MSINSDNTVINQNDTIKNEIISSKDHTKHNREEVREIERQIAEDLGLRNLRKGEEYSAYEKQRIYEVIKERDLTKIANTEKSYKTRLYEYHYTRMKDDPDFRAFMNTRPLGSQGNFNAVDIITMYNRWKVTCKPYGEVAHKRYMKWKNSLPAGPSPELIRTKEQVRKVRTLWDDIRFNRLEPTEKELNEIARKKREDERLMREGVLVGYEAVETENEKRNRIISTGNFQLLRQLVTDEKELEQIEEDKKFKPWNRGQTTEFDASESGFPIIIKENVTLSNSGLVKDFYKPSIDETFSSEKFIKSDAQMYKKYNQWLMKDNIAKAEEYLQHIEMKKLKAQSKASDKRRLAKIAKSRKSMFSNDKPIVPVSTLSHKTTSNKSSSRPVYVPKPPKRFSRKYKEVKPLTISVEAANATYRPDSANSDINSSNAFDRPDSANSNINTSNWYSKPFSLISNLLSKGNIYKVSEDMISSPNSPQFSQPNSPSAESNNQINSQENSSSSKNTSNSNLNKSQQVKFNEVVEVSDVVNNKQLTSLGNIPPNRNLIINSLNRLNVYNYLKSSNEKKEKSIDEILDEANKISFPLTIINDNDKRDEKIEKLYKIQEKHRDRQEAARRRREFITGEILEDSSYNRVYTVEDLIDAAKLGHYSVVIDILDNLEKPVFYDEINDDGMTALYATLLMIVKNEKYISTLNKQLHLQQSSDTMTMITSLANEVADYIFSRKKKKDLDLVIQILLHRNANINFLKHEKNNMDGLGIFHWAAQLGHVSMIRWLAATGADPGILSSINKKTPLMFAAENNEIKAILEILKCGGHKSINYQDINGWSPLHYAAANATEDLVQILLICGADPKLKANSGYRPFEEAKRRNKINIENILIHFSSLTKNINEYKNYLYFYNSYYNSYEDEWEVNDT